MMKLLKIAVLIGVGYVLGAKAGRERYEQIARTADKVRHNPTVQAGVARASEQAPVVADAVKHKAADVASAAGSKLPFGNTEPGAHAADSQADSPAGAQTSAQAGSHGTGS